MTDGGDVDLFEMCMNKSVEQQLARHESLIKQSLDVIMVLSLPLRERT